MMKQLWAICLVLIGSFAWADPPKIEFPNGNLRVVHGKTIVEFLPDGSTRILSPMVSITIPGKVDPDNPLPPRPPSPEDDLGPTVAAMYGADVDPGKSDKLVKLIGYWKQAVPLVKSCATLGDLANALKGLPALPGEDLRPIRELFRERIRSDLGTRADAPLDQAKASALFARFVSALEGCR
jgi:hypothetical protein